MSTTTNKCNVFNWMSSSSNLTDDELDPTDDGMLGKWAAVKLPKRVPIGAKDTLTGRTVQGACFVPLAVTNGVQVPFILMGKQTFNWRTPMRGNRWSLLGGSSNTDEAPWETAAREFWEETCGEVRTGVSDELSRRDWRTLATDLRDNKTVFHLTLEYMQGGVPRSYHVYVKLVPWDPHITRRFKQFRKAALGSGRGRLLDVHPAMAGGHLRPECNEMSDLQWWSVHKLHKAVFNRGGIITNHKGQVMCIRMSTVPLLAVVLRHIMGQCTT